MISLRKGLLVVVVLLVSAAAHAEDKAAAKAYFEKATAAFGLGHYGEAAAAYEKAFGLKADAALLYNAAQAYRLAGNKPRALDLYRNYARLYGRKGADVSGRIADLEKAIAAEADAASAAAAAAPPPPLPEAPAPATGDTRTAAVVAAKPAPGRPLTKRPVFWAALGGAVLLGGLTVFLVTRPGSPPSPTFGSVDVK